MAEFSKSTKQAFTVTSQKRRGFRIVDTLVAATPELLQTTIRIPRLGSVRPVELDISYGIRDDPDDELVEFFLLGFDAENIPDVASCREQAIWQRIQNWRAIGTDHGPIQTISKDVVDFFSGITFLSMDTVNFDKLLSVGFIAVSDAASSVIIQGVIYWEETILQRVWSDDNAYEDLHFEETTDEDN